MFKRSIFFIYLLSFCIASSVIAQTPTAAQIEQFKRLPPSQQKALAQSMGVDLDEVLGSINGGGNTQSLPQEQISGSRSKRPTNEASPESANFVTENATVASPTGEEDKIDLIDALQTAKKDLKKFGYDLFNYGADTFTPASDIPIPADYVLGPGDSLILQLYGKESATHNLTISRDGSIQFPEIGPISLAGLTYSQMTEKVSEIVSEQMIGIKASVTMGPLRTVRVFVLGEVKVPGSYVVGSLSTMTNALFASGGVNGIASLRNIQLKRAGKTVTTLDLYDLLLKGDTSGDSRLLPGDVIFVPPIGRSAAVTGAVKRPAVYELKNEKTLAQLLELSGGLLPTAYTPTSKIERVSSNGEKTLVNVDINSEFASTFKIEDADVLHVGALLNQIFGTVSLKGHVKREDVFAWKDNLRFTDLIHSVDAMLAFPDLDIAIIERENPNTKEISVISFSPGEAFAKPKTDSDPLLQKHDNILVFGYEQERSNIIESIVERLKLQGSMEQQPETVHVEGSVRFPGEYPLTKTMTTDDLVLLAGGFTEDSLGSDAELTRITLNGVDPLATFHIEFKLNKEALKLQEGDTLRVKQVPMWGERETVTLDGEFLHPGVYSIIPGETFYDVIKRAGGLNVRAFPEGTVFSRADLRDLEEERLEALKKEVQSDIAASQLEASNTRENIDAKQAEQILENIDSTRPLGRLVIDLPKILKNPELHDFELLDGDTISVPRYKPSITVVGEVQYPTSHFFDDKLNVKDYLERSGGLKYNADKKRIYVVKANGRVFKPKNRGWFNRKHVELNPGDTIIVPLDTTRVDKLTVWASVTRIMYEAALGVAALSSL